MIGQGAAQGQTIGVHTAAGEENDGVAIVNVAGKQVWQKNIEDISDEQFERTFQTNVFAPFWIVKAAMPHLEPGATIVNTASLEAYTPAPDRLDYAATKGAINNLSKGMAQQLITRGIRVNVVAPGPTWSASSAPPTPGG